MARIGWVIFLLVQAIIGVAVWFTAAWIGIEGWTQLDSFLGILLYGTGVFLSWVVLAGLVSMAFKRVESKRNPARAGHALA